MRHSNGLANGLANGFANGLVGGPANRLAFATGTADWPWAKMLELAQTFGYGAIEITAGDVRRWQQHPLLRDAAETRRAAEAAGIAISMLATTLALSSAVADIHHYGPVAIALATALGTPAIRVFGYRIGRGRHKSEWLQHAATQWRWLIERGAAANIDVLLQNGGDLSAPADLWALAEMVNHPRVGLCWDLPTAHARGDAPSVGISTLNTRIKQVHAADYATQNGTWLPVSLGTGKVPLEAALDRLSGIGYTGTVCLATSPQHLAPLQQNVASLPNEAELAHAGTQLRQWLNMPALALDQTPEEPQSTPSTGAA